MPPDLVPIGPVFRPAHLTILVIAAGPFILRPLNHHGWAVGDLDQIPYAAGLYLLLDSHRRIIRLGHADRRDGIADRICEHVTHPQRGPLIDWAYAVGTQGANRPQLQAMEGYAADHLNLRPTMTGCIWPHARDWTTLIANAHPLTDTA
jgi:hypothetical protein